jgi:hypothetical protein
LWSVGAPISLRAAFSQFVEGHTSHATPGKRERNPIYADQWSRSRPGRRTLFGRMTMGQVNAIDFATFDINALSQGERTEFYRDAIRRAHQARAAAVSAWLRTLARQFERRPLLTRALADSAAVLAMALAIAATVSAPVSARMQSASIEHSMSTGGGTLPLLW